MAGSLHLHGQVSSNSHGSKVHTWRPFTAVRKARSCSSCALTSRYSEQHGKPLVSKAVGINRADLLSIVDFVLIFALGPLKMSSNLTFISRLMLQSCRYAMDLCFKCCLLNCVCRDAQIRLPQSKEEIIEQAYHGVLAAWRDGKKRQTLEILLPLIGATELDDW